MTSMDSKAVATLTRQELLEAAEARVATHLPPVDTTILRSLPSAARAVLPARRLLACEDMDVITDTRRIDLVLLW